MLLMNPFFLFTRIQILDNLFDVEEKNMISINLNDFLFKQWGITKSSVDSSSA